MSKQHVGIIGIESWTGGIIYVQNLVRALASLPIEERPSVTIFYRSGSDTFKNLIPLVDNHIAYQPRFAQDGRNQRLATVWRRVTGLTLGESHTALASALCEARIDVAFPITYLLHRLIPCPLRWIPDFQHRWLPGLFKRDDRFRQDLKFRMFLKQRGEIVLSSEHAKSDALRFYGQPKARLHVLRFTTVPESSWYQDFEPVRLRYNLPRNYLIICNQFWMHKGHKTVFEALALLAHRGKYINVVCTGATSDYRNPRFFSELTTCIKELGIDSQVFILGQVPRHDQILLMRGASAVVQPSLFEGWSTPLEDARALGKPVIASDFPVHLEQDIPNAIYFRQSDSMDCARAIEEHYLRYEDEIIAALGPEKQAQKITEYARQFMRIVSCCHKSNDQC